MERINFEKYKTAWIVFLFANILTYPLSPMGGGLMSKSAYAPFMWVKLSIAAILILVGSVLWVKHLKFLRWRKQARR